MSIPGQVCLICFADMFVSHLMKQHENANAGELSFKKTELSAVTISQNTRQSASISPTTETLPER